MSLSTLLISIPVILVLAVLVRAFWIEILTVILVLRALFYIAVTSFGSALVWAIGIENDKEGFWQCWMFFAILYTTAAIVLYFIINDAIDISVDFIRKLFK